MRYREGMAMSSLGLWLFRVVLFVAVFAVRSRFRGK